MLRTFLLKKSTLFRGFLSVSILSLSVFVMSTLTACGGGPNLPGTIELIDTSITTPLTAIAVLNDALYIVDENAKLVTYDISDPEDPKKTQQLDAFKGPHLDLRVAYGDRRLLLIGEDGKVALFDLSDPKKPSTIWGGGKTVKLMDKTGPYFIYESTNALYMTPGGKTLYRYDLNALDVSDPSTITTADLTKTFEGTGGGGGVTVMFDDNNTPVRMYVAHATGGKIDAWLLPDLEGGGEAKPSNTFSVTGVTNIKSLRSYKKSAGAIQGWLVVGGDSAGDPDLELLDLGRNFKDASEPKSAFTAKMGAPLLVIGSSRLLFNSELQIWTFAEEPTAASQVAELSLKATPRIRAMVNSKNYIYAAQEGGLKIYKFDKGKETTTEE